MAEKRSPKNPDPNSKPRVAAWYKSNPMCKIHIERLILELGRFIVDDSDHGYLNMKDQNFYRFGNSFASFGNAHVFFNKTYSTVQFWLNSPRQKVHIPVGGFRKKLKSKDATDLYAVEFKIPHGESFEPVIDYVLKNAIPGWVQKPMRNSKFQDAFNEEVVAAANITPAQRRQRIKKFPKIPAKIEMKIQGFVRNPYVVAEVLLRANGECEECGSEAPFTRSDGTPYLEVHHKIQLAHQGEDTVDNAQALCPNCHREKHFGQSVAT
jgi:hypothetical protein